MSRFDVVRRQDEEYPLGYATPGATPGAAEQRHSQLPQKNVLHVMWRGRWIILLCVGLGVGGGFLYLSRQTRVYASSSRILIEPERNPISYREGPRAPVNLSTYCELIKSSLILERVGQRFPELRQMKTFAGADSPVGALRANLSAEASKTDDLITVSFQSPHPQEAASVVNAVVGAFEDYVKERNHRAVSDDLKKLQDFKESWEKDIENATRRVEALRRKPASTTRPGATASLPSVPITQAQEAWSRAYWDLAEARRTHQDLKAIEADATRRQQWTAKWLKEKPEAQSVEREIQRAEADLSGVRSRLGDAHETVRNLVLVLEALRAKQADQPREAFEADLSAAEERYNAARRKEADLRGWLEAQQKNASPTDTSTGELAEAEREVARLRTEANALEQKIKGAQVTSESPTTAISVLERAQPAASPIKPKPATVIFQALMIGLVAGCGLSYLRDLTDHRLASVDEIQARLGLNVLGVLPHMDARETAAVRGQKVQLDPMSDVAEAYRTVRTAVYFGAPEGKTKKILVTSPAPGDGKTTSASNLAIAMAQAGQRVLLMDCDFRKPMQHRLFGIEDGLGLSSVLSGQAPLSKAVKQTSTQGLFLLPSGPVPRNPSEILNSQNFAKLLAGLEQKFDHIVIDSPPVAPVTDAQILGASCDLTILVLRAQKSTRRVSENACDSLLSVGSRILGVIVNDVPRGRGGYGYSSYGYYRYGYGPKNGSANGNGNGHADCNGNGTHAPEGRTNGAHLPAPVKKDEG